MAAEHGLTFGPDPATHSRNTLGGMIGNNSCGVHSVMAEFYGAGPLTVDQIARTRRADLRRSPHDGRRDLGGRARADHRRPAAARGRSTASCATCATGTRTPSDRLPGHPAPGVRLQPGPAAAASTASTSPRRSSGTEGTCVVVLHATLQLMEAMPNARPGRARLPRRLRGRRTMCRLVREHRPVGLEGIDPKLIGYMSTKGLHPDDVDLLPEGEGFLLVEFGADDQGGGRRAGPEDGRRRLEGSTTHRASRSSTTTGRSRSSGRCASRGSAPPPRCRACARPIRAGRTPPCRPSGSATTCATSAICSTSSTTTRRSTATSARAASTAASTSCSTPPTASPSGASSSTARPTWWSPTGARCRASTATARRGRRCWARCTARSSSAPSREFKDIWDPDGRMNPGKVVRPDRPDAEPAHGARRAPAARSRPTSPFPTTTTTSAARGLALRRGRQVPRRQQRHDVPELHGDARGGGLHPRPRRGCCSRCCAATSSTAGATTRSPRRSTSAWPARAARANARSTSTWRPTRPSSSPTTTSGRLRPRIAYAMGLIYWWARARQPRARAS